MEILDQELKQEIMEIFESDIYNYALLFHHTQIALETNDMKTLRSKSRKVSIKNDIKNLTKISIKAKELSNLLKSLDKETEYSIGEAIGRELGVNSERTHIIAGKSVKIPSDYFSSVATNSAISKESEFLANFYDKEYGGGYLESFISDIFTALFMSGLKRMKCQMTLEGKVVKFLALLLHESESMDRVHKLLIRSKIYNDHMEMWNKRTNPLKKT
ncbi:hypothetical protein [Pseudoalteromonas lipolytica]|uniref:hypothetical protein n=1 Tax=Pseudoalteromonas lipolytica TaxID=570156 RepID=UPI0008265C8E|nr:hypothetical protein [Pseudoalteromonas lipolytica]